MCGISLCVTSQCDVCIMCVCACLCVVCVCCGDGEEMCGISMCACGVVCSFCVCVVEGEHARRKEVPTKKQEPHTSIWGKKWTFQIPERTRKNQTSWNPQVGTPRFMLLALPWTRNWHGEQGISPRRRGLPRKRTKNNWKGNMKQHKSSQFVIQLLFYGHMAHVLDMYMIMTEFFIHVRSFTYMDFDLWLCFFLDVIVMSYEHSVLIYLLLFAVFVSLLIPWHHFTLYIHVYSRHTHHGVCSPSYLKNIIERQSVGPATKAVNPSDAAKPKRQLLSRPVVGANFGDVLILLGWVDGC